MDNNGRFYQLHPTQCSHFLPSSVGPNSSRTAPIVGPSLGKASREFYNRGQFYLGGQFQCMVIFPQGYMFISRGLTATVLKDELRSMLRGGDWRSVLLRATEYFRTLPSDPLESVWIGSLACNAAAHGKRWGEAVSWADRTLAIDNGAEISPEALGWMHLTLSTTCMYTGDYCRADKSLSAFQQYAETVSALKKALPDAQFNGAVLKQCMKRLGEDIPLYQAALLGYKADGRYGQVLRCHIDLAWSFLLQGAVSAGTEELAACSAIIDEDVESELLHDYRLAQALLLRLQGNLQQSAHLSMQELHEPDLTPGQQAEFLWISALNAQALGDANLAWDCIERAHKFAVDEWWPPLIDRVEAVRQALRASRVGR